MTGSTFAEIKEWRPLWKLNPLPAEEIALETVLLVVALAAWRWNRQRRWSQLVWLLLLSGMFAAAERTFGP